MLNFFHKMHLISNDSTYPRLINKYRKIVSKKKTLNGYHTTKYQKLLAFFNHYKKIINMNTIKLNIEKTNKLNASSLTLSSAAYLNITEGDLKHLSLTDIKALMGHEFGHFFANGHHLQHELSNWVFSTIAIMILVSIGVAQLSGLYQILTNFIFSVSFIAILIILLNKDAKKDEYFADSFGAFLLNPDIMIQMISHIADYQKQKLMNTYNEMEQLKTVPLAYLACRFLYTIGQVHYMCTANGYCIHPTATQRIAHLRDKTYLQKVAKCYFKHINKKPHLFKISRNNYNQFKNKPKKQSKKRWIGKLILDIATFIVLAIAVYWRGKTSSLMFIWYMICLFIVIFQKYATHKGPLRLNNLLLLIKIRFVEKYPFAKAIHRYQKIALITDIALILMIVIVFMTNISMVFTLLAPYTSHSLSFFF